MQRIPKLPIGKMNVLIKKCPVRACQGSELKKGYSKLKNRDQDKVQFNRPVLCITLRKAA